MSEQKEGKIPWEFRINKLKEAVRVNTNTGTESFNYWNIEDDKLDVGYNSPKETFSGSIEGSMIDMGGGQMMLDLSESEVSEEILNEVLPVILEDMEAKGVKVAQVIRPAESEMKMAA